MADFLTRLSERTLGMAQVVQPAIAPAFAPEPTGHPMGLEWDGEAPTGDPDRAKSPPTVETPPAWGTSKEVPQDTVISERGEEQGTNARITQPHPSGTSDVSPEPHQPARSSPSEPRITTGQEDQSDVSLSSVAPESPRRTPESRVGPSHLSESDSSERGTTPGREDQRGSSRVAARHPQTPPEIRPETTHRAEPGPTPPGASSTSQDVSPENLPLGPPSAEDESDQAVFRPVRTLVDHGQGEALPPRPSPGTQASLDEDTPGSKATPDLPEPPDAPPPVAPRMIRPRLDGHLERGPREPRMAAPEPSEPRMATPEPSAPDIRVAIGRIEVRAITPPPPASPPQRTAPARPGPALSLDDYLKQRNGGRR